MKPAALITIALLLAGCNATIVYAPKTVEIIQEGRGNAVKSDAELRGSDIEDFKGGQTAEGSASGIPGV